MSLSEEKSDQINRNRPDQISQDLFDTYCSTCKDLFKQNLEDRCLVEPLRRIILIGKCDYSSSNDIKKRHNEMVKNIQQNILDKCSKVSGLMIVHKSFFYHIAEGSDEALNEVIKGTANFVNDKLIHGAKVIRSSSIAFRYFDHWNSCVILTPGYKELVTQDTDITEESEISEVAQMIQKFEDVIFVIAAHVRFLKSEIEEKLNELMPTSVLPFRKELERMYNEPFFLTVEKYVERYLEPYDYISYIEQEWPPTGPVHDAKAFFEEMDAFEKQIEEDLKIEEDRKRKKARYGSWWWA